MKRLLSAVLAAGFLLLFSACDKERFINSPDAQLGISTDSLRYDTVFTTTGSITKSFKIFNSNDQRLRLSTVRVGKGAASAFKMNVNGVAGNEQHNIDIAANDSIYVFVTATIDPSTANLPFIVQDSIIVEYNSNKRFVQLEAFGQNANFIRNGVVAAATTFNSTLPYVILGGLTVSSSGSLALAAGTKMYFHADAPLIVDGTLIGNGTKANPVLMTGDRLDDPYRNFPASWPGVYIRASSKDNVLNFTNIKNAYRGVSVSGPPNNANPKLVLSKCIVDNAYDAGLLFSNTTVSADNCLISNSGSNVYLGYGGNYSFLHCTLASYSTAFNAHRVPVLFATNANEANQTQSLTALFRNCIMWGDSGFTDTEVTVQKIGTGSFSFTLDHCLYRAAADPANTTLQTVIRNLDPKFDSVDISNRFFNFRTTKDANAPGINKGAATTLLKDLDDLNRNVGLPDLGAYEKQ